MAYNVSNAFREQCYKGSSLYKCRLIIGGNIVPTSQLASITISSPIIDSSSQTFYIGTFISQKLTIQFKNLNGIEITSGTNVELYISQYVNNEWVEVPIGKYLIDESPENYYKSSQIECLDYAIKFATNLDYSPAFVDNKITIDNLLQWICNHYGVTLGNYPNTNGNVEIGTYDSTVSGKRWISYIAEIKGCNAKMDRLGRLTLVPLKSPPVVTINALKSKSWELGEKYEIKKVIFFDAIRNYTYGDDTGNILYLRQDNPFIINTNIVQNVYNAVKDFVCWSLKCENYGDISLDSWDRIAYTLGNSTYHTLNNNTITYAMTIMSKVETKIPTKQQEVTTNVVEGTDEQRIRRLKTEINNIDNTITLQAQQIETNTTNIATNTSNISTANTNISNLQTQVNGISADFDDFYDNEYVQSISNLQDQIDGAIQFWNGSEIPTINNYPANLWTTEEEKRNHEADIYSVIQGDKQGKSYRFAKVGNVWQWVELTDNELSAVQQLAQNALNKANTNEQDINNINDELSNPTNTLTGTYFDIDNALDEPLVDFSMEGQTEQDSTTGKNILMPRPVPITSNGITMTYDENTQIYTFNGTCNTDNTIFRFANNDINFVNGTTKSITYWVGGSVSNYCYVRHFDINYGNQLVYSIVNISSSNSKIIATATRTFVGAKETATIRFNSGSVANNLKIKLMVTNSDDTTYEPYTNGPAPNPDYPQDIHCVSGDNTIEICGKNLLSGIEQGTLDSSGRPVASTVAIRSINYDNVVPNTQYTVSINGTATPINVAQYDKNKSFISFTFYNGTFTTSANTHYIKITKGGSVTDLFQIEKGSTATDYVEHQEQSQLISLGVENLFNINSSYDEANGVTISIDGNVLTQTNTNAYSRSGWVINGLEANKKYMLSCNYSNASGSSIQIRAYKSDKSTLLSQTSAVTSTSGTFELLITPTESSCYLRFYSNTAGTSNNYVVSFSNIQLEKGSKVNSYTQYGTTPIELCKIGNYKDYIHRQDNRWYLHKEIGKVVLNGAESWGKYSGTKRFYLSSFTQALAPTSDEKMPLILSNYYKVYKPNQTADITINAITLDKTNNLCIRNVDYNDDTLANFKTWLSIHNTDVYYVLAEPIDTEITGTLLEQLNRLMTLPLYKDMTHITIEPNDLIPIMNIEYVRDTAINSQFVRQPQLNNYYTRTETTAQINISNSSIKSDVAEIQTTLDNNGNAISSLSSQVQNLQTSTSQQINVINQTLENGVEKLTNSLVTIDINGINTSKDNETFNTQITNKTFEVKDGDNRMGFMGFDTDKQKMLVEFPEMQTQKLTNAYHTTEKITEDGLKWSADFYVGDDN